MTRLKSTTNTIGEAWFEYISSGLPGDVNGDGIMNATDLSILIDRSYANTAEAHDAAPTSRIARSRRQ
ncbi:MAG: hypothetical protein O2875_05865 [Planctomycetota bacterium]|nr:hypothetical protein [Planctomycetota bacterium]MDA1262669.1 hypothetical protein [Planctomycetota bacterium]